MLGDRQATPLTTGRTATGKIVDAFRAIDVVGAGRAAPPTASGSSSARSSARRSVTTPRRLAGGDRRPDRRRRLQRRGQRRDGGSWTTRSSRRPSDRRRARSRSATTTRSASAPATAPATRGDRSTARSVDADASTRRRPVATYGRVVDRRGEPRRRPAVSTRYARRGRGHDDVHVHRPAVAHRRPEGRRPAAAAKVYVDGVVRRRRSTCTVVDAGRASSCSTADLGDEPRTPSSSSWSARPAIRASTSTRFVRRRPLASIALGGQLPR